MSTRRRFLATLLGGALAIIAATPAGAAAPALLLPDLRVAVPTDLALCGAPTSGTFTDQNCPTATKRDRLLRFTSVLLNTGSGPFTLHSTRPSTDVAEMTADQIIQRAGGGPALVRPTDEHVHWGLKDDGHPHWHAEDVERYRLFRVGKRLPGGFRVGAKRGYCFFDDQQRFPGLPGSPVQTYLFNSCGQIGDPASKDLLELTTGLSVGWSDVYGWGYAGQWVDLAGLPDGQYLLCITADPAGYFRESRKDNNEAWVRIRLRSSGAADTYQLRFRVLDQGRTRCQSQLPYRIAQLPPASGAVTATAVALAAPWDAPASPERVPLADRRTGGASAAASVPAFLCTIGRAA